MDRIYLPQSSVCGAVWVLCVDGFDVEGAFALRYGDGGMRLLGEPLTNECFDVPLIASIRTNFLL